MQLTEYKIYCKIKLPIMYRMIVLKIKLIFKNLCGIAFAVIIIANMCGCNFVNGIVFNGSVSQTSSEQTEPSTQAVPERNVDTSYGYNNLSDESLKDVYVKIDEYAQNGDSDPINLEKVFDDKQLSEAIAAYRNDHPEVFWLEGNFKCTIMYNNTYLYLQYKAQADELDEMKSKFNAVLDKAVADAPKNSSQYELELYANDYIVNNCEYDYDSLESETILKNENDAYGVFVDKKAVCEGYARAFQLLCNRLGIDCVNITGYGDDMLHQWNCALIDGEWYYVDVTWNDESQECDFPSYNYFNTEPEAFEKHHTDFPLYKDVSYDEYSQDSFCYNLFVPECTAEKYCYYSYSCVTFHDYGDADKISDDIAKASSKGEEYYRFVISDEIDFISTVNDIVENGYLYEWIGDANYKNGYNPELNGECTVYYDEPFRVVIVKLNYI